MPEDQPPTTTPDVPPPNIPIPKQPPELGSPEDMRARRRRRPSNPQPSE